MGYVQFKYLNNSIQILLANCPIVTETKYFIIVSQLNGFALKLASAPLARTKQPADKSVHCAYHYSEFICMIQRWKYELTILEVTYSFTLGILCNFIAG